MNTISALFLSALDGFLKRKTDLSFGLIKKLQIDKDLKTRDWPAFENKIQELSEENLTRILDGLCLSEKYDKQLVSYINFNTSSTKRLVSGSYNLHIAWLRRSGQWGASLSKDQIEGFDQYLEKSKEDLIISFDNLRYETEAKARLIRVSMGMSEGEAAQETFHYVLKLSPNHLLAYLNYFKVISPKWLGSVEVLQKFVQGMENTQLGNLLKLMYVIELYSDKYLRTHKGAKDSYEKVKKKLVPHLLSEIKPLDDDSLLAIYTNNYLACLYRVLGMHIEEIKMSKYLLRKRTIYPWAYFN